MTARHIRSSASGNAVEKLASVAALREAQQQCRRAPAPALAPSEHDKGGVEPHHALGEHGTVVAAISIGQQQVRQSDAVASRCESSLEPCPRPRQQERLVRRSLQKRPPKRERGLVFAGPHRNERAQALLSAFAGGDPRAPPRAAAVPRSTTRAEDGDEDLTCHARIPAVMPSTSSNSLSRP